MGINIKFTVITVCFNSENEICKTIESVLNQDYGPYEYLVIDGMSTDNTVEIAKSFQNKFKEKNVLYKIISEKDTGIYNAMNKGISIASGDFISYLNAGDWYEKDALKNINDFYNVGKFELTYGGLHYIKKDGTITNKMSRLDTFPISSRHWNHPSMFLKKEIYQKYFFNESFPTYADFELYLKLRKDGTKIRVIDKIITNFVADGVSTDVKFKNVLKRAREKYKAYRNNGFSLIYMIESYGWEILKSIYFRIHS